MTKKELFRIGRKELAMWHHFNRGLVMAILAILFAYIYRISEGEPIEAMMDEISKPVVDYQI